MNRWYHLLFKKRLPISPFVILPLVLALTAFASGFIALVFLEYFFDPDQIPFVPPNLIQVREAIYFIKVEILIFTTLGLFAGLGIAYAILIPLRRVMGGARRIADGDFSAQMETRHLDELGVLGNDFNLMVSSLNQYFIDNLAGGWILLDKTGEISSISPGACVVLGLREEELCGKTIEEPLQSVSGGGEMAVLIRQSLKDNKQVSGREMALVTGDRRKIVISLSIAILKGSEDHFMGVAVTIKDLTREREIQDHMQRTDQLAALGTMAAGLAHEIRNPLGSIKGLTQLLEEGFQEGDKVRIYTRTMIKEIDRLNEVVTGLLNFAQPVSRKPEWFQVNPLVDRALALARMDVDKKELRLEKNFSPSLPAIRAEEGKLVQAFLNILLNAMQAVPQGGEIRVLTRFDPRDSTQPGKNTEGEVVVEIHNSGPPIEGNVRNRMFDPFFTTKKEGTGLGLAITDQIIALHGGSISHETQNGLTVFILRFPAIGQRPEEIPAAHLRASGDEKPPPSGGEDLFPSQTTSSS